MMLRRDLPGLLALAALSACAAPQPVGPLSLGPAERSWTPDAPVLSGVVKSTGTNPGLPPDATNPATLAKGVENGTR